MQHLGFFGTPRKLPKASSLVGRVVVLDIAFAGAGTGGGFPKITLPLIEGLGARLGMWVDHHDSEEHALYKNDPRFRARDQSAARRLPGNDHARIGGARRSDRHDRVSHRISTAWLAPPEWIRNGVEPYAGADDDARAIDTRIGTPSPAAERIDRAIRARFRDQGLFGVIVRHLVTGLADSALWQPIDEAAAELVPVERETRRAALAYKRLDPGVALVDVSEGYTRIDKTLLLLLGQERETVSVVIDRDNVSVAARFDSGKNFVELFGLGAGMPTRVSVPRPQLPRVLKALGVSPHDL